jgi:hypothetical protein
LGEYRGVSSVVQRQQHIAFAPKMAPSPSTLKLKRARAPSTHPEMAGSPAEFSASVPQESARSRKVCKGSKALKSRFRPWLRCSARGSRPSCRPPAYVRRSRVWPCPRLSFCHGFMQLVIL